MSVLPFESLRVLVPRMSIRAIAAECGVSDKTVHRWVVDGMSVAVADLAASRLGWHPSLVWPEWEAAADAEVLAAALGDRLGVDPGVVQQSFDDAVVWA